MTPVQPTAVESRGRRVAAPRVSRPRGSPILSLVAVLPILTSGFVDLPRHVRIGDWSGIGFAAVLQLLTGTLVLLATGAHSWQRMRVLWPFFALLAWLAAGMVAWWTPHLDALPNALGYALLGVSARVAAHGALRDPARSARAIDAAIWVANVSGLAIAALSIYVSGLSIHRWLVHPRAIALVGLLPLCWHLARWASGRRWDLLPAAAWVGVIVLSLSRMAAGAAIVATLCTLALRAGAGRRTNWRQGLLLVALLASTIGAILGIDAFRERLLKQDRLPIWRTVVNSAAEAPLLGHGPGSSQVEEVLRYWWSTRPVGAPLSLRKYGYHEYWQPHPHNEFLRVWHDLGLPGIALFSLSLGLWLRTLYRACRESGPRDRPGGQLELAGLLVLVVLMIAMLTDNPLVYPFVIAPAGVIIGAGLGAATRRVAWE